eukprot:6479842-Amphidinium_carterae.1
MANKLEPRWMRGVWLGKLETTDEHIIGTETGLSGRVTSRSVMRRPESRRWDAKFLQKIICSTWAPTASMDPPVAAPTQRYITRAIIDRLGATAGCPACEGKAGPHTRACRENFEKQLRIEEAASQAVEEAASKPTTEAEEVHEALTQMDTPAGTDAMDAHTAPEGNADADEDQPMSTGDVEPRAEAVKRNAPEGVSAGGDEKRAREEFAPSMVGGLFINEHHRGICVQAVMTSETDGSIVYGHISGQPLDADMLEAGRQREREQMQRFNVFKRVQRADARGKCVRSMWLDDYKQSKEGLVVRSRLVAMEFATDARYDTFAGTPPLMAIRLAIYWGATLLDSSGRCDALISLYDVSTAFFHAALPEDEPIHVIPPKGEEPQGVVWQLLRAMNGTRMASFLYQRISAQAFWCEEHQAITIVHGDDSLVVGRARCHDKIQAFLEEHFEIKALPRIGPDWLGGCSEGYYLKRRIGWTREGFTWEADEKHAQTIINRTNAKAPTRRTSPSSKHVGKNDPDAEEELKDHDIKTFQSLPATALYLSADRPDIQQAASFLMRGMSKPLRKHEYSLHRLAVYLAQRPRLEWLFKHETFSDEIYIEVDSDWAGDRECRRSVDGGFAFQGSSLIDGWTTTQHTVALSSGEAEYYGTTNGAARGMWIKSFYQDMNVEVRVTLATDSSAAKGIATRVGSGKLRHIDVKHLWLQEKIQDKALHITKIKGTENRADIQTKAVEPQVHEKHVQKLPLRVPSSGCHGTRLAATILMVMSCTEGKEIPVEADDVSRSSSAGYLRMAIEVDIYTMTAIMGLMIIAAVGMSIWWMRKVAPIGYEVGVQTDYLQCQPWHEAR